MTETTQGISEMADDPPAEAAGLIGPLFGGVTLQVLRAAAELRVPDHPFAASGWRRGKTYPAGAGYFGPELHAG